MSSRRNSRRPKKRQSFNSRVKKVIYQEAERKYFDATATDTSLINTDDRSLDGAVRTALGGIVQGDTVNTRDGSEIMLKGLQLNLLLTTTVSASLRMMLVHFPNHEAGLDFSPLDSVGVNGLLPRQDDIEGRYSVVWQRNMDIDPDSKGSVSLKKYFKLNKKVVYKDSVTNPIINSYSLYVFTNNTTADAISIVANSRLFFKDL